MTAADILVETLQDWGVDTVFGLPGDGINGIMEALRRKRDAIRLAKYSMRIMGPAHVENVTHLACRTALLYRGVAHITFPVDLQIHELDGERSKRNVPGHMSDVLSQSARLPHEGDLAQAADILNQGS